MAGILDRAADGGRITPDEALLLYTDAPLHALGQAVLAGEPGVELADDERVSAQHAVPGCELIGIEVLAP
jgi:hypothetical protein